MKNVMYFKEGEVWRVAGGLKGLLEKRHTHRMNLSRTSGRRRIHKGERLQSQVRQILQSRKAL